ncbi:MAG: DUF6597 domain-containing transcriptional factor [Candidatus Riflebacteria bacterium]
MSSTNYEKIRLAGAYSDDNLELFVAGFWEIEAQNINPGRHIIIPDGRMGVIIEITNSSSWLIGKKRWDGNIVIGQQTAPVALDIKIPFYRAFGITFNPWGAAPFFGSSLDKYKNKAIPIHELFAPDQEKVLRECKDFAERVDKASAFLSGLLTTKKIDIRLVNSVKKMMDNFFTPLSEITSDSSTSLRNLEIVARKQFGETCEMSSNRELIRHATEIVALREIYASISRNGALLLKQESIAIQFGKFRNEVTHSSSNKQFDFQNFSD